MQSCKKNSLRGISLYILILLLLSSLKIYSQQAEYVSPAGTKFLLYTPPGYNTTTTRYPMLLSLHSKGEVGDNITELTSNNPEQMPCRLIYLNKWPKEYPFIVLTPQLRASTTDPDPQWPAEYIDEVVRYVMGRYRVDSNRVYLTGISRGGTGSWTYASAFPGKIAAMVPLSGRSDLTQACPIKDIPIWAFHGDGDGTAPASFSKDMVNAISACQPAGKYKPHLTILNAKGHNGWNEVYNGSNGYRIFEWLLQFKKNDFTNRPPYVSAGQDLKIAVRNSPITLVGYFFDAEGPISNVEWRQVSGSSLDLAETNSRFLKINDPKAGIFEFDLVVTDNAGAVSSDRVKLEIVSAPVAPYASTLTLVNGRTNLDVGVLSEGQVINLSASGLTEINIRATASIESRSVRFSINSDDNTRTLNTTSPLYIKPQAASAEWIITPGEYRVCATPYSSTSGTGTRGTSQCIRFTVIDGAVSCTDGTKIVREQWNNVLGKEVRFIPVTTPPTSVSELSLFEGPRNIGDNYGARIRGMVCPPASGNYYFFISSDDYSELWLSTDEDPANKRKIAYVTGSTGYRQWNKYTTQKSAAIALQSGRRYYIEALHKEGTTYDHVSVGWQLPNGVSELPIPGGRLSAYNTSASLARSATTSDTQIEQLNIYPNPNGTDELSLDMTSVQLADGIDATVTISSTTGKQLLKKQVRLNGGDALTLQLPQQREPGLYYVVIVMNEAIIRRKVFLK